MFTSWPGCAWAENAAAFPKRGMKEAGARCDVGGPGHVLGKQCARGGGGGG